MLKNHTLPSGTTLGLDVGSWAAVGQLRRALARELKVVDLVLTDNVIAAALTKDPKRIIQALGGADANVFKNLIMQLLGSEEVEHAVFACMVKCTLTAAGEGPQKIVPSTFEPEARREDFLPAAVEVIRLNLTPFFKGLSFGSKDEKPAQDTSSPG